MVAASLVRAAPWWPRVFFGADVDPSDYHVTDAELLRTVVRMDDPVKALRLAGCGLAEATRCMSLMKQALHWSRKDAEEEHKTWFQKLSIRWKLSVVLFPFAPALFIAAIFAEKIAMQGWKEGV